VWALDTREWKPSLATHVLMLAWDLTDSPVTFAELRSWVANKAAADSRKFRESGSNRGSTWFSNEQKKPADQLRLSLTAPVLDATLARFGGTFTET